MARTAQQIIESTLGSKDIQIAALTAALEDANEKAEALQKAADVLQKSIDSLTEDKRLLINDLKMTERIADSANARADALEKRPV